MSYKRVILYAIVAACGLGVLVYALPARSERLTPKEIERQVISEGSSQMNDGGYNCVQMAKRAKELAEANGYKAVYRQNITKWDEKTSPHRWLVIYVDGKPVEILKKQSSLEYAKDQFGWKGIN